MNTLKKYYSNTLGNAIESIGLNSVPVYNLNNKEPNRLNISNVETTINALTEGKGPY